jgi:mannose/fructose/N-acetylgalactosamine-specific phosphotransferase system component IIB
MPKVWNRLQKLGKKAAKFNITLFSHELVLTCLNSKWYPNKVRIIWSRKSKKKALEFVKWEPNLKNIFIGNCHWNQNEEANFDLTLYKSTNSLNENDYDLKELLIEIENVK